MHRLEERLELRECPQRIRRRAAHWANLPRTGGKSGTPCPRSTFATRFNWKEMIGPVDKRPGHMGCWGYRSSDGFGLPEYLRWCQQLGAEPILGVFAGYVLNGQYKEAGSPEMALYTQEALEEIEYITGPVTSEWGRKRAADGFPKPFPLVTTLPDAVRVLQLLSQPRS